MSKRIVADHVSCWFGAHHAVDDVSLVIEPKQVTALIGPSGCGKSTFIRTLNRMHEVVPGARMEGRVLLDDADIYQAADATDVRRVIGMVFQRPNPFPTLSVRDNVVAGARLNGLRGRAELDALAERSLRQAGLWDEVKNR